MPARTASTRVSTTGRGEHAQFAIDERQNLRRGLRVAAFGFSHEHRDVSGFGSGWRLGFHGGRAQARWRNHRSCAARTLSGEIAPGNAPIRESTGDSLDEVAPRELHLGAAALAALIWLVDTQGL